MPNRTGYAIYHHGYPAFFDAFFRDAIGLQIFVDLVIALALFAVWMWRDAGEHGISPLPYLLLIPTLGSIGALGYLVHREVRVARASDGSIRMPVAQNS